MGKRIDRFKANNNKRSKKNILIFMFLVLLLGGIVGTVIFLIGSKNFDIFNDNKKSSEILKIREPLDLQLKEKRGNTVVPILMYHLVSEEAGALEGLYLRTSEFEEHLQYFKENNFTTITMKSLQDYWEGIKDLPEKPIILTFDDGSVTVYNNAYPLMKKYDFISTQFIISSHLGNDGVMNAEQIKEMALNNHEIGSHSYSHLDLTNISELALEQEINQSKKDLEFLLEQPVVSFCYPSGRFNVIVQDYLKKFGYFSAVTTMNGFANKSEQGVFSLKRVRINRGDTGDILSVKLSEY